MDEVTKEIQGDVPWIVFADDIVLAGEYLEKVNKKLDVLRSVLKKKGLELVKIRQNT